MDALAVAIISAGAAIAAALITAVLSTRKMDKTLAVHDERSTAHKDRLCHEHEKREKEHGSMMQQMTSMGGGISFLREERLKEAARQEVLRQQHLDIAKTMDVLNAMQEQLADSVREVKDLRERLAVANAEIVRLNGALQEQEDEQEL